MESSYQKTTRDTAIIGISTFITFITGMLPLPLLTKTLGPQNYGLWIQVNATVGILLPFVDLGLITAMIRFLAAEKKKEAIQEGFYSVLVISFFISLSISLAVVLLANPLANHFFDGNVMIARLTGPLILLATLNPVCLNLLRTFQQIKSYTFFTLAQNLCQVGLLAFLVLTGHGIFSVVLSMLALQVAVFLILFFLIKARIGIRKPNFSRLREFLRFGLPTVPRSLAFWLVELSDRYIISFFLGTASVGVYSAAYGLGNLPYSVMSVLTFVLLATLSLLYDEGRMAEVRNHLSYSLKYFLAIVIPFIFGSYFLGEPVIRVFSTPAIASQGRFIVPLIALASALLGIHGIISQVLVLAKKTGTMALIWIGIAVLNLGLNIWLVPRFGILGAAAVLLLVFALATGLIIYYSLREIRFAIHWQFLGKCLIASTIMSLAIWWMRPQDSLHTVIAVFAGIAIYSLCLIVMKSFTREEISLLRGLLKRDAW